MWLIGAVVGLESLMVARAVAPGWAWAWWAFLALWLLMGLIGLVVIAARVAYGRLTGARPGLAPPAPRVKVEAKEDD